MLVRVGGQIVEPVPRRRSALLCPKRRRIHVNERGYRVGESHHRAKVTARDVELIRELREEHGLGLKELAVKFNLAVSTVCDICKYRIWAQEVVREREVFE